MKDEKRLRKEVGNELRNARRAKGLTMKEVADKAGMLESSISKVETGKWSASLDILQRICDVLGCSISVVTNS